MGAEGSSRPAERRTAGWFLVEWEDMEYITQQGDSWAFSDLQGFQARDLNFNVFGRKERNDRENEIRIAAHRHSLAL